MKQLLFSIVMPTYNSQKTIGLALSSLVKQTLPRDCYEILVIDGGSTDDTVEIARSFGAVILQNPDKKPEYAKRIGFVNAQGKYLIEMDSDEELIREDQLVERLHFLEEHPEVKVMVVDKLISKGIGLASRYINVCGDPFTQFIYNRKGSTIADFRKKASIVQDNRYVFNFLPQDIIPIGDGGTTLLSLEFINACLKEQKSELTFAATAFDSIVERTGLIGCIEDDNINHYSSATLKSYLSKLRFRVLNNIFNVQESGFSSRAAKKSILRHRKILFCFYALSFILPFYDSIRLSILHRDPSMLLHIFYLYYTCFYIVICLLGKCLGRKLSSKVYG